MLQLIGNIKHLESIRLTPSVSMFINIVESSTNFQVFQNPIVKPFFDKIMEKMIKFNNILIAISFVNVIIILAFCLFGSSYKLLKNKYSQKLKEIKNKLCWSSIIRTKTLMYFPICYSIFSHIQKGLEIEKGISFVVDFASILILPIFSLYILTKNFSKLE